MFVRCVYGCEEGVLVAVVFLGEEHAQQRAVVAAGPFSSGYLLLYALKFPLGFGELAVVDELEVAGYEGLGEGHGLSALFCFVFFGFFYAVLGDFEDAFAIGEVGAGDKACYADGASRGFA